MSTRSKKRRVLKEVAQRCNQNKRICNEKKTHLCSLSLHNKTADTVSSPGDLLNSQEEEQTGDQNIDSLMTTMEKMQDPGPDQQIQV